MAHVRLLFAPVLVALLAACAGDAHNITGDLYYAGFRPILGDTGDKCIGQAGTPFVGLQSGTEVELTDGSGNTIGLGKLAEAADSGTVPSNSMDLCHFTFEIPNAKKADFYKLTIGGVPGPTYSYDDLAAGGWKMTLR